MPRMPNGMIFTPCRGGVTHNNRELATKDDRAGSGNLDIGRRWIFGLNAA